MVRTKKTKSSAKFGPRYGSRVKQRWLAIDSKQRQKQKCPFCKKLTCKRVSSGIFLCKSCGKKFTSGAYFVKP